MASRLTSLRARVFVPVLVMILAPIILFSSIAYVFIANAMSEDVRKSQIAATRSLVSPIDAFLNQTVEGLRGFATDAQLVEAVTSSNYTYMNSTLEILQRMMPEAKQFLFMTPQGYALPANRPWRADLSNYNVSGTNYYLDFQASFRMCGISQLEVDYDGELSFAILCHVDKLNGPAILMALFPKGVIGNYVNSSDPANDMAVFVVDKRHNLLSRKDTDVSIGLYDVQNLSFVEPALSGELSIAELHDTAKGGAWLFGAQTVREAEWVLLTAKPWDDAFGGMNQLRDATVMMTLFFVVVAFALAGLATTRSTKPILRLRDQMVGVAQGQKDLVLGIDRRDEIGEIVRAASELQSKYVELKEKLDEWNSFMERTIAEKTEDLTQKSQELEAILYTLSHDMKAPIISMQGFVTIFLKEHGSELTDESRYYMTRIKRNLEMMEKLIVVVLDYSKLGRREAEYETLDVKGILDDLAEAFRPRFEERHVKFSMKGEFPKILGERMRIVQVFQNLLDNAVKYTANRAEPEIEVGVEDFMFEWHFYVRDNGVGIPEDYQKNLFRMFHRMPSKISEEVEGTGMGLAIARKIVDAHDGRIWVESKEDEGTAVWIALPKPDLRQERVKVVTRGLEVPKEMVEFGKATGHKLAAQASGKSAEGLIAGFQDFWSRNRLGWVSVASNSPLSITVESCAECQGMKHGKVALCKFTSSTLETLFCEAGINDVTVNEVECAASTGRICRFSIELDGQNGE